MRGLRRAIGSLVPKRPLGRRPRGGRAVVLLYHRIAKLDSDPWDLAVSPDHFRNQLEVVRERFEPISLDELAQAVETGSIPDRGVAVSFDDGYCDNLHAAKPVLERLSVPAVVFVTTAALTSDQEFWWDELERVFLQPGTLPEALEVEVNGRRRRWELGGDARYERGRYEANVQWRALRHSPPTRRHDLYLELCGLLKQLPPAQRGALIEQIRAWSHAPRTARASHRALTIEEALELGSGPLVAIGAHTVNHPLLSTLSSLAQRDEMEESKAFLEQRLGRVVRHFAYPFGGRRDYTKDTVKAARHVGFETACSNRSGIVDAGSDLLELRRIYASEMSGASLEQHLSAYFGE